MFAYVHVIIMYMDSYHLSGKCKVLYKQKLHSTWGIFNLVNLATKNNFTTDLCTCICLPHMRLTSYVLNNDTIDKKNSNLQNL